MEALGLPNILLPKFICNRRNDSGQALVFVALSMFVLIGILGLAIDMGNMRYVKRQMQTLADAAAMAGAREVMACGATADCAALTTASQEAMNENGVTSYTVSSSCTPAPALGAIDITIMNGPSCIGANDPNNGNKNYVEVIVAKTVPTAFAQILGISSAVVSARAEAGIVTSTNSSAVLLGRSGNDLVLPDAADQISAGGGIYVNSSSNCNGNAGINASGLFDVGTNSGCTVTGGAVTTGNLPVTDPLAYLEQYAPCSGDGCGACTADPGTSPMSPGTYCGLSGGSRTFKAGTYVIEGALAPKTGTWTGTGVTFFLTGTSSHSFGGIERRRQR